MEKKNLPRMWYIIMAQGKRRENILFKFSILHFLTWDGSTKLLLIRIVILFTIADKKYNAASISFGKKEIIR